MSAANNWQIIACNLWMFTAVIVVLACLFTRLLLLSWFFDKSTLEDFTIENRIWKSQLTFCERVRVKSHDVESITCIVSAQWLRTRPLRKVINKEWLFNNSHNGICLIKIRMIFFFFGAGMQMKMQFTHGLLFLLCAVNSCVLPVQHR